MGDTARRHRLGHRPAPFVGLAVLVGALIVIAVVSRDGDMGLAVPAPGDVSAEWLDGHPVFVVSDPDGSVRVLDAISPHDPEGVEKVLAWCESSRMFEDLWDGSKFDRTGAYVGGPAPTGLASYDVVSVADGRVRVRVGAKGRAPARSVVDWDLPPGTQPCDERTAPSLPGYLVNEAVLDDLVLHTPRGSEGDLWIPTPKLVLGSEEPT